LFAIFSYPDPFQHARLIRFTKRAQSALTINKLVYHKSVVSTIVGAPKVVAGKYNWSRALISPAEKTKVPLVRDY
jgi:hypothetical protein